MVFSLVDSYRQTADRQTPLMQSPGVEGGPAYGLIGITVVGGERRSRGERDGPVVGSIQSAESRLGGHFLDAIWPQV